MRSAGVTVRVFGVPAMQTTTSLIRASLRRLDYVRP